MTVGTEVRRVIGGSMLVVFCGMIACTASKKSAQKIELADNLMQQVEQVEAMDYASAEFKEAQIKLEEARRLAERRKYRKSVLVADEAMVAAELAEIKTLSRKAEESIQKLKASIQSLRDQLEQYRQQNER